MPIRRGKRGLSEDTGRQLAGEVTTARRTPADTFALQERIRRQHTRQLHQVAREALLAWTTSCREQSERALAKFAQALEDKSWQGVVWDDTMKAKVLDSARGIFAGHGAGDPRYMGKLLEALADERKIWDANLTGKRAMPAEEARPDDEPALSNDERIALLTDFIERAGAGESGPGFIEG